MWTGNTNNSPMVTFPLTENQLNQIKNDSLSNCKLISRFYCPNWLNFPWLKTSSNTVLLFSSTSSWDTFPFNDKHEKRVSLTGNTKSWNVFSFFYSGWYMGVIPTILKHLQFSILLDRETNLLLANTSLQNGIMASRAVHHTSVW